MQILLAATNYWDSMVVGHVSTYDSLSDRVKYPTFARVSNTMTSLGLATKAFLSLNNWTRVALVYSNSSSVIADGLKAAFNGKVDIVYSTNCNFPFVSEDDMDSILQIIKSVAKS